MLYKQFYNLYGKEFGLQDHQHGFQKKERTIQIDEG